MKFRIFTAAAMLALIVLLLPSYYYNRLYIIKVTTDKPDKAITLEYTGDAAKNVTLSAGTDEYNVAEFKIPTPQLQSFRLQPPSGLKILGVVLKGQDRLELQPDEKLKFADFHTAGRRSLDFKMLMYMVYFSCVFGGLLLFCRDIAGCGKAKAGEEKWQKLLNIEFLRIIFTLGVVCCHFFGSLKIYSNGGSGVEFFFILSGYLLALTDRPEKDAVSFVKSKFIRFVPLVVFGGLICSGGFSVAENIFFLQNTGMLTHDTANAPAWYIGVLFWVLLFYFLLRRTFSEKVCNLIIGVTVFCSFVICAGAGGDRLNLTVMYLPRGIFRGLGGIGLGYLLEHFCRRTDSAGNSGGRMYSLFETVFFIFVMTVIFVRPFSFWNDFVFRQLELAVLIVLFVVKKGRLSNFLEKPVLAFPARYCLSVYLTHWYVIRHWRDFVDVNGSFATEYRLAVVTVILTLCWLFGVFAHHAVEKPATEILRKTLNFSSVRRKNKDKG